VPLEQTKEKYFSVHLYDAVTLAFGQFNGDADPKSLLVISKGNDYFPGKAFKQIVFQARQLQMSFDIAMAADHNFYCTKGQRYGFDLWFKRKSTPKLWLRMYCFRGIHFRTLGYCAIEPAGEI